MTPDRRTVTEAGEASRSDLERWHKTISRRHSEDILDRLTFSPRPNQPPVLTEQQAAAGRLLRMHYAEAQISIKTTFNGPDDRVDISRGPLWEPPYCGGSPAAQAWLRRMEKALDDTDREIVMAIAVMRQEPKQVYEALQGRAFIHARREITTHIRRAFEALRVYCDGA